MNDLSARTLKFSLSVVRFYSSLPKTIEAQVLGKQLLRSGTSVGAHYRESIRSRSKNEFVAKIDGGLQELEETRYWLELLLFSEIVSKEKLQYLMLESNELVAILTTISKNTKKGIAASKK